MVDTISSGDIMNDDYKLTKVHVVTRHGDRSPVAPLGEEMFWARKLATTATLLRVSAKSEVVRDHSNSSSSSESKSKSISFTEKARRMSGVGIYGKLTEQGIQHMEEVGRKLRKELSDILQSPKDLKVYSTDMDRTIQSAHSMISNLFADDDEEVVIPIHVIHPLELNPDIFSLQNLPPNPELSEEERALQQERVDQGKAIARQTLKELRESGLLREMGEHYLKGVDEDPISVFGWILLKDTLYALRAHGILPDNIKHEEVDQVTYYHDMALSYIFQHPDVVLNKAARKQIVPLLDPLSPKVTIWSAHDFTLMGLMAAYKITMPYPETSYASVFKTELLEGGQEPMVRFSMNGKYLQSEWDGDILDMVPLSRLQAHFLMMDS